MSHILTLDMIPACYCCVSAEGAPAAFTLDSSPLEGPCPIVCVRKAVWL